jgi:hypothetical protein
VLITSSAFAITSALAPPPMSRKLAAEPPTWWTTSSVLIASPAPLAMIPTVTVEADVLQALLLGERSRGSRSPRSRNSSHSGMAEGGVVVEGDLGVERVHLPVGGEHQRVDLDEVGVALDVAAVEL